MPENNQEDENKLYMLLGSMSADISTILNKFGAIQNRLDSHSARIRTLEKASYGRTVLYTATMTITPIIFTLIGWLLTK